MRETSLISWYHRWWKGSGRLRNSATPQAQRPCLSSHVWCKVEQNSQANIVLQSVIRVAWTLVTKTRDVLFNPENPAVHMKDVRYFSERYTLFALTVIYFNSEITSIKFTLGHWGYRYSPVRRPDPLCRLRASVSVSGAEQTPVCLCCTRMLKWVLCHIDWRSAL